MKRAAFIFAAVCFYAVLIGFVAALWQNAPGRLESLVVIPLSGFLLVAITTVVCGLWKLLFGQSESAPRTAPDPARLSCWCGGWGHFYNTAHEPPKRTLCGNCEAARNPDARWLAADAQTQSVSPLSNAGE